MAFIEFMPIEQNYQSKNPLLNQVIGSTNTVDLKLGSAKLKLFSDTQELQNDQVEEEEEMEYFEIAFLY